jgi:hypothetical protein
MIKSASSGLSFQHLALAFLLTGTFWMLVQLFTYLDWGKGGSKAMLLALVAMVSTMILLDYRYSKSVQRMNVTRVPIASVVTSLAISFILYEVISTRAGALKLEAVAICVIIVAPLGAALIGVRIESVVRHLPAYIIGILIASLLGRLASFVLYLKIPYLIDIARTTLNAVYMVLKGRNPYAFPIDWNPAYPDYRGYKYLPTMIATYLPLGSLFGAIGMRLTNLALDGTAAFLVGILARRHSGWVCGMLAASLYLMLPMLPRDIYLNGVTDLAPTVFLLAAVALYQARPGVAGVMVGLSVAAKLLPGLLMVVCCFPASARLRYVGGILLGLTPAVVFFLLAPADFMHNIFWFPAARPIDNTSWLFGMPSYLIMTVRLGFVLFIGAVAFAVVWRPPDFFERCSLYVLCSVAALLVGPTTHNNYMLWWLPFFCVLLSLPLSKIIGLPESPPDVRALGWSRT